MKKKTCKKCGKDMHSSLNRTFCSRKCAGTENKLTIKVTGKGLPLDVLFSK